MPRHADSKIFNKALSDTLMQANVEDLPLSPTPKVIQGKVKSFMVLRGTAPDGAVHEPV